MKRLLARAGAGLTTLGLGGIATYWIAVATTSGRHSPLLFFVFGGVAVVGLVGCLAGQERPALSTNQRQAASVDTATPELYSEDEPEPWSYEQSSLSTEPEASAAQDSASGPPFTGLWHHTSDGFEASPLMTMASLAMPGYFGVDDRPFVRIGVTVACDSIPPDSDSSEAGRMGTALCGDS